MTVFGSGVSIRLIGARPLRRMLLTFGSLYRSRVNLTSSAVKGRPSCQVTPLRKLKVQLSPSGAALQVSARSAVGVKSVLLYLTSWLKTVLLTSSLKVPPPRAAGLAASVAWTAGLASTGFAASAGLVAAVGWAAAGAAVG